MGRGLRMGREKESDQHTMLARCHGASSDFYFPVSTLPIILAIEKRRAPHLTYYPLLLDFGTA